MVHAEQYNSPAHGNGARPNCDFMPRLHSIPLRTTTLPSYFQTSAARFVSVHPKNDQSRGDTDVRPTASTLHTPIRVAMFRGRFAPLSRFALQTMGLTGTSRSANISPLPKRTCSDRKPHCMFKTPERKEFPSRQSGSPR